MTRTPDGGTPSEDAVPTGTERDETVAENLPDGDIRDAAAADSTGDDALADAGLPAEGTEPAPAPAAGKKVSLAHRLYNGEAGLDVVGKRKFWFRVVGVIVLVSVLLMVFRGFNFGIDFAGGNSFRVPGSEAQITAVRSAAEDAGAEVASVQVVGGNSVLIRTGALSTDSAQQVETAVAAAVGVSADQVSQENVSADWGRDITDKALIALVVFLAAVVAFLAIRFQPKMAIGAIVALVHDLVVTAGIYALIGFEVSPSTIIGLLTILGFSLYDTVVVFDKVEENTKGLTRSARSTYGEAANLAVNQTLMRSINTSVIALLPVAGLLFVGAGLLGAGTLKDLALVLFVGLAAGTYSSIFLATPVVAELKEREPEMQQLRKRVLARRTAEARSAAAGPVASARRARRPAGGNQSAAVLADRPTADVQVESPDSVRPTGPTGAPRPGQRPQRPAQRSSRPGGSKSSGKRRR